MSYIYFLLTTLTAIFSMWVVAWLFGYTIADAFITKLNNDSDNIREIIKELKGANK